MTPKILRWAGLSSILLFSTLFLYAQNQSSTAKELSEEAIARYKADAFRPWETKCMPKGCIISIDVLRGESEDPPNANDVHEYISIAVAIDRQSKKPGMVIFQMTPYALQKQGIFLAFTETQKNQPMPNLNMDSDGAIPVPFRECNPDTCIAVADNAQANKDGRTIDLLAKFLSAPHLMLLYVSNGHAYRTMVLLAQFQKEYARVMREDLGTKPAPTAK